MLAHRHTLTCLVIAASLSSFGPLACSGENDTSAIDHHDDGSEEAIGTTSSSLSPSDAVASAVAQSCSTTAVKGLAVQLVEEIQCMRPNTFARIDGTPGLALGAAVLPYLQTEAAQGLISAQKARGVTMSINSALRTLPQQYLLHRWYQTGRCGIGLAASPGTSNHEGAIAVDINDNAAWRASMQGKGFRWLGASDPVHYDFIGGGTVDLRGLSVTAFQRLWNRNHPTDEIAEDGAYGSATAARLAQSPVGGFAKGADCKPTQADAGAAEGGGPATPTPAAVPAIPDATEAADDEASSAPPAKTLERASSTGSEPPATPESDGCSIASPATSGASSFGVALAIGAAVAVMRRRRRRS